MDIEFFNKEIHKNKNGIYAIQNKLTKKIYIGSSSRGFRVRYREHLNKLKNNIHPNAYLQNDFNTHKSTFIFHVIEVVDDSSDLINREQVWLNALYDNQEQCYNLCKIAGSRLGLTFTEEHKNRIKIALKGKKKSKEHIEQMVLNAKLNTNSHFSSTKNPMLGKPSMHRKKVKQIDILTNNVIATYNSLREAAKAVGLSSYANISGCCSGRRKTTAGYKWEYV